MYSHFVIYMHIAFCLTIIISFLELIMIPLLLIFQKQCQMLQTAFANGIINNIIGKDLCL